MELAVQKLAIVNFFVIGLSHIIQPRAWAQFVVGGIFSIGLSGLLTLMLIF
jgi:hypothetical protein